MSAVREAMVKLAKVRFGKDLRPVRNHKSLDQCFTDYDGELILWFNTPDHSTHIVSSKHITEEALHA